jgi:cell division protein FtsB
MLKSLSFYLILLCALLQAVFWFSWGGYLDNKALNQKLLLAKTQNINLEAENQLIQTMVDDLKLSHTMVEVTARQKFNLMYADEQMIQVK